MSFNITLNSSNVVAGTNNNSYQFNFKTGGFEVPDGAEICVNQITIPYSWVNISSALGNNVLGYVIICDGNILKYFSTTLADGFYDANGLNSAIQTLFRANGHYWISSTSVYNPTYIYPLTISYNSTLYTTTVNAVKIPAAASITTFFGATYSAGSWSGTYPTTLTSYNYAGLFIPQTVTSPQSLGYMLGFTGDGSIPVTTSPVMTTNGSVYPTLGVTTSNYVTSNGNSLSAPVPFPPLGSSVNSLLVRCNLVDNHTVANTDILDSIGIAGVTYAANINYMPVAGGWVKMKKGKYNSMMVYFQDQNFNSLKMLDPNVMISLLIRFK